MNYLRFRVEDLVMDESFQQYCTGTNPAAVRFWEQWQAEHPEKQEVVRMAKALYLRLNGGLDATVFAGHHQQFAQALRARGIYPGTQVQPPPVVKRIWGWKTYALSVAAVLAVMLTAMLWIQQAAPVAQRPVDKQPDYTSKAGERKSFQLPDGSRVVLNARSKLWLEDSFHRGKRTVTLEGEAFFDVAQQVEAPFIVRTAEMNVTVLGTALNVRAYEDDEVHETSLIRGRVRVDLHKCGKVYLRPSEKVMVPNKDITLTSTEQISTKRPIGSKANNYFLIDSLSHIPNDNTSVEISWVENQLVFSNESFAEIARRLERWYDVKVRFEDDALRDYHFTGHFSKEPLQRVLEVLQLSRKFSFRVEDDQTIVVGR